MRSISMVSFFNKILDTGWLLDDHKTIAPGVSRQLDTMRGLSAIVVLIAHAHQIFLAPIYQGLNGFFGLLAQASVMVFFVLSGFLICKSITRNYRDNGAFNVGSYAVDRFNRIFPPLAFSIVLLVALTTLAPLLFPSGTLDFIKSSEFLARNGFYSDVSGVLGSLIFLNGFLTENISSNAPLWSLSYEVWYYFVIALVLRVRGGKGLLLGAVFMIVVTALNKTFMLYGVVWFLGAGIALLHNKGLISFFAFKLVLLLFGMLAALIGFFYLRSFFGITTQRQAAIKLIPVWNVLIGVTFASVLALVLLGKVSMVAIIPKSAGFSYTLYIVHFPILLFIYGVTQAFIMDGAMLSIVVASISAVACLTFAYFSAGALESYRPIKYFKKNCENKKSA
jgi:peptidoglycan/LPS O-acetylase OafA/YrhL